MLPWALAKGSADLAVLVYVVAMPYEKAAPRPAAMASAPPWGSVSASTPASSATPSTPNPMPNSALGVSRVRSQTAPMAASHIGAVALRTDSKDADSVCAA